MDLEACYKIFASAAIAGGILELVEPWQPLSTDSHTFLHYMVNTPLNCPPLWLKIVNVLLLLRFYCLGFLALSCTSYLLLSLTISSLINGHWIIQNFLRTRFGWKSNRPALQCRSWVSARYHSFYSKFVALQSCTTPPMKGPVCGITSYNFHFFYFSPIFASTGFTVICTILSFISICISRITNGLCLLRSQAMPFIQ